MVRRGEVIAVIGGGASGVLSAVHLQRQGSAAVRVVIIEPRATLGDGVAYGTTNLDHVLNVRAGWLSALSNEPDHFTAWAQRRSDADAQSFLPRSWYGDYLRSLLEPIEHIPNRAVDVTPSGGRARIELCDGPGPVVDRVVLAPGSSPPEWPKPLAGAGTRWISDPWAPGAIRSLPRDEPVLLVGTGLTAVDIALSLSNAGYRRIVAVSRHGWLPSVHPVAPAPPAHLVPPRKATASTLLAWVRATAAEVGDWAAVVDALRPHTDELWGGIGESDRARLLRHVRRRWEVLRHRMAPSVGSRITAMRESGELTVFAGAVQSSETKKCGIAVDVAGRRLRFGGVVNCSGPSPTVSRQRHSLVSRLVERGVARPGPLDLGLETDEDGYLPSTDHKLQLVGPLRRGRRWETTAIPEIRTQAEALSRSLWHMEAAVTV